MLKVSCSSRAKKVQWPGQVAVWSSWLDNLVVALHMTKGQHGVFKMFLEIVIKGNIWISY